MFQAIKIDPSFDFIGRAATRSVISSINFRLLASAQAEIRERLKQVEPKASTLGHQTTGETTVDNAEDAMREKQYKEEEDRRKEELGQQHAQEDPQMIAGMLAFVKEYLVSTLTDGTGIKDERYDGAESLVENLDRQINRQVKELTARQIQAAEAVGYPVAKALESAKRSQSNIAGWLRAHREDILNTAFDYMYDNPQSWEVETVFSKLPAIVQLQMYFAADNGLHFAWEREMESSILRGRRIGETNAWLISNHRQLLRKEIEAFMKQPAVARELHDCAARGIELPRFQEIQVKKEKAA